MVVVVVVVVVSTLRLSRLFFEKPLDFCGDFGQSDTWQLLLYTPNHKIYFPDDDDDEDEDDEEEDKDQDNQLME